LLKILDFGIAKAAIGVETETLTKSAAILGTPAYMSPEQMRSARAVDARSDLWSLGVVLYELVEGRRPFEAPSFPEMCVRVSTEAPPPLQHGRALERVIAKCLQKDPAARYQTIGELREALLLCEGGRTAAAPAVAPGDEGSLASTAAPTLVRVRARRAAWF